MKPPPFSINFSVTHNGETRTVREWIYEFGISYQRARKRYSLLGWTLEDAVTIPPRESGNQIINGNARLIEFNDRIQSLSDWGRELGMSYVSVAKRLRRYPVEIALSAPKCNNKFVRIDGSRQTPIKKVPKFSNGELGKGVTLKIANQRMRNGWTREEAAKTQITKRGCGSRWGHSRGNINRIRDLVALGIAI